MSHESLNEKNIKKICLVSSAAFSAATCVWPWTAPIASVLGLYTSIDTGKRPELETEFKNVVKASLEKTRNDLTTKDSIKIIDELSSDVVRPDNLDKLISETNTYRSQYCTELDRKRIIDIFDVYFKEELCKSGALSNYYTLTAGAVTLESIKCANEALLKQGEKLSDIQHNVKEINAKVTKALSICRTLLNECGFILIAVAGCLVAGSISQLNVPFFYLYYIISYIFSATFTSSIQKTLNLKISAIKNSEKYIRSNHFLLAEVIAIYTLISVGVYLIIVETQPLLQQSVEQSVEIRLIEIICVFVGGIISQFLKSISQVCFIDAKDM